jgi:hypothetical protein
VLTPVLAFVLAGTMALAPLTPAFAATSEDINVTGYSLSKGTAASYTGALTKGDRFTLTLDVSDTRPFLGSYTQSNPPSPKARLNTSSLSVASQSDIRVSRIAPLSGGGWSYTLGFTNLSYTGSGQDFRADIFYPASDGAPLFSYSQTLSQCVPWTAPDPSSESAPEPSGIAAAPLATVKGTGFVLASYDTGSETVYAGKPFTLNLVWLATKGSSALENVTVNLTPSQEIALAKGANLNYVGSVAPGAKISLSYELLPGAAVGEGSYTFAVDIKGIDAASGGEIAAQASVTVPVVQPERFSLLKSSLPTELALEGGGEAGYGSVTLINQGRTAVSNVFIDVVGTGIGLEGGRYFLGSVAGGEQKTADLTLKASKLGTATVKVLISYENARGEARELSEAFAVTVIEAEARPDTAFGEEIGAAAQATDLGFPWWIVVLIVPVVALGLAFGLATRSRKRRAAEQAILLEDTWEDEDEDGEDGKGGIS